MLLQTNTEARRSKETQPRKRLGLCFQTQVQPNSRSWQTIAGHQAWHVGKPAKYVAGHTTLETPAEKKQLTQLLRKYQQRYY